MPIEVLEFDARGRTEVARGGAYIDTGEVKTSLDYAKGVQQLGIRLGVLMKAKSCVLVVFTSRLPLTPKILTAT